MRQPLLYEWDGFVAQKEYGGVTESGLKEFLIICGLRM